MRRWWLACALAIAAATQASAETDVGWTQRIGAALPLELTFLNERDQQVRLSDYFQQAPVVIVFAYLSCSRLCPEVLSGVDEVLRNTGLAADRDYQLVVLSIDPQDVHRPLQRHAHFLTSPDGAASRVAAAAGFRYRPANSKGQIAHAAGFVVATPHGTISRYFFGARYSASEVKAALLAARKDRAGSLAERLVLLCYGGDVASGSRSATIITALRASAIVGMLVLVGLGWALFASKGRPS